ncbi:unnamed protein product, partial [Durusdinium trenchii]
DPERTQGWRAEQPGAPTMRFDTWAPKRPEADEWPATFNARLLEVKKQVHAAASRRRHAERQAELARVPPCRTTRFTRTRRIYASPLVGLGRSSFCRPTEVCRLKK